MTLALSPRQHDYVRAITALTAEVGRAPTQAELAGSLGIATASVSRVIHRMKLLGAIVTYPGSRGLHVTDGKPGIVAFLPPDIRSMVVIQADRAGVKPEAIISAICRQHFAGGAHKGQHHHGQAPHR